MCDKLFDMLYSALQMVIIKNRFVVEDVKEEPILFSGKTIMMKSYTKVSEPVKSYSDYIAYVNHGTMMNMAAVSNKFKVVFYIYLRIIENHEANMTNGVTDYSMNIQCSVSDISRNTGLSYNGVCKIIESLTTKQGGQDFPVLFEEEDGSYSLSYLFCPFKNLNEVLYYEEKKAKKYYEEHGTDEQRKKWRNIYVMQDMKRENIAEYAYITTSKFPDGMSNYKWIMGYIYYMIKGKTGEDDFHIDYKELLKWISERTTKVPTESYLRKTVGVLAKNKTLMLSRKTAKGRIWYKLNMDKVKM